MSDKQTTEIKAIEEFLVERWWVFRSWPDSVDNWTSTVEKIQGALLISNLLNVCPEGIALLGRAREQACLRLLSSSQESAA